MVLTRDLIGFSGAGDAQMESMMDHIPLEQIQAAYEVEEDRELVEIQTLEDGINSGRVYQIRATYGEIAEVCLLCFFEYFLPCACATLHPHPQLRPRLCFSLVMP